MNGKISMGNLTLDFKKAYGFLPYNEPTMMGSVRHYVVYGLSPGSCTSAILRGDLDYAIACAHPSLKNDTTETIIYNGTEYKCTYIVKLFLTVRFIVSDIILQHDNWPGFINLPKHEQVGLVLENGYVITWINDAATIS